MAQETITAIREAEEKAGQTIADAETRAKAIVDKAREDVKKYETELLSAAKEQARLALEEVTEGKDDAMEAARRRSVAMIAQSRNDGFEEKRKRAIELVYEEIV